ncbi:Glycosyltransferase involved in cell wall bisynthesis [Fibrobacter sp. UWT3]|uniref:glycosyltransferase family 2 protein n=1 Tax=Fibrobacter sp. UWT3 TaxID=1896225 RepID=UPI000BD01C58|nr:glycosyltransferase family 2 protein [Fibrobacter sp. UWT3]SOE51547.1 Glycosyltransferase involved in cell wall bisynthesis [Fibrobacter sp. UWT3]
MTKQPLLSICIPTWNRAKILSTSLNSFREQLTSIDSSEIEIFVSDNASDDDTPQVVQSFIDQGLPITYSRNPENVGAARNFLKCMQWASGKYIWLLGDDDLLKDGSISYILDLIQHGDYGLIHLSVVKSDDDSSEIQEYSNHNDFLESVSYWITFMSGCIFLKESVALVENCERYIPTHLLQVPFYIMSASLRNKNLFVRKSVMQSGVDFSNNGGYNFYQVFVESFLNIWTEYVQKGVVTEKCYEYVKKDIMKKYIAVFNWMLLIRRKNVASENVSHVGNRKGYKVKNAWKILFRYYGNKWYFWMSFPLTFIEAVKSRLR